MNQDYIDGNVAEGIAHNNPEDGYPEPPDDCQLYSPGGRCNDPTRDCPMDHKGCCFECDVDPCDFVCGWDD
jgi:hypothetical protein